MEQEPDFSTLAISAGQLFTPASPIREKDLFSGRSYQIRRIIDVIFQSGQHVIIFGERGVGKTSLANVLSSFASAPNRPNPFLATRINCDRSDTFETVWEKVFDGMQLVKQKIGLGFGQPGTTISFSAKDIFKGVKISPNEVRKAIVNVSNSFLPVIIIDEFDRLDNNVRRVFADLIKSISDDILNVTVILIGVGDSVSDLISEHQSVARALVQIQMPRMTIEEIKDIINKNLDRLGMTIDSDVIQHIAKLSKGLPHYAHLLALHATRNALDERSMKIHSPNFEKAVEQSVEDAQYSIKTDYHTAIRSGHKDNIFSDVLLSCAVAVVNEMGEFAANDLRQPLKQISGRDYEIASFTRHLTEFCEEKRGNILIKSGEKRSYRYRFADPLMQPFVSMQGIIGKKINAASLA